MSKIEDTLETLASPICDELGVYIYDVEYKKEGSSFYLRLFIDKDGGVSIDDCENVSKKINPVLDEKDFIKDTYIFEVSSPGIDRVLKRDWHFEKAIGKNIDIKLFAPVDGKKEITGKLISYNGSEIIVEENGKELTVAQKAASSVRLAFEF